VLLVVFSSFPDAPVGKAHSFFCFFFSFLLDYGGAGPFFLMTFPPSSRSASVKGPSSRRVAAGVIKLSFFFQSSSQPVSFSPRWGRVGSKLSPPVNWWFFGFFCVPRLGCFKSFGFFKGPFLSFVHPNRRLFFFLVPLFFFDHPTCSSLLGGPTLGEGNVVFSGRRAPPHFLLLLPLLLFIFLTSRMSPSEASQSS